MTTALITTAKERCRMCYTCVRECPAKAIRIVEGQAEVVGTRCIACGNCVRVCSQQAKQVAESIDEVEALLASDRSVAACLAPSFPAEFTEFPYQQLVGMLRELGFDRVHEVSFGADLVARHYRQLLAGETGRRFIATSCPAVVGYVERYHPEMVDSLAPIVSPMVAMARAVSHLAGEDLAVVFIGPCIAKKAEADSPRVANEISSVLTFPELRRMFARAAVEPSQVEPSDFDPPHGRVGGVFPIGRGMLQTADIQEDLMTGEVVAAEGRNHTFEAIREFAAGDLGARLLEALCCEGCIMGAGIDNELPLFNRRRHVRRFTAARVKELDAEVWNQAMADFEGLDLSRQFMANDQRIATPAEDALARILHRLGKESVEDELNCGACGYETCRAHAVAIYKGLAEHEMCLPNTIDQLRVALKEVEQSKEQLASAQEALMHSEKLASMGQLAAGIAHEVNNPLGVVLMYAHLLLDESSPDEAMREDLRLIAEQADRCKKIVAGLLHFARQNRVIRADANICEMVDGLLKVLQIPKEVALRVVHELNDPVARIDCDQLGQVLTNLISNALGAMPDGGRLTVRTSGDGETVSISVSDTGCGIPEENRQKIFEPFFTTKTIGKGTGLGLAVSYGIVKMHHGDIEVESNADPDVGPTGTSFTLILPRDVEEDSSDAPSGLLESEGEDI
jgi:signal transduction histidine kinase/Fe-S-cluster-containing hydrogenase component 2